MYMQDISTKDILDMYLLQILDTDNLVLGVVKCLHSTKDVYVDPKIVYNLGEKTTNLHVRVWS